MSKFSVRVYTGETFRLMDGDIMDNSAVVKMTAVELAELKAQYSKTLMRDAEMLIMYGELDPGGAWIGHPKMFWGK